MRHPLPHHGDRLGVVVDEHGLASERRCDRAGRAAAGEEVEHDTALRTRRAHDAPQDADRLLRRVAEFLLPGRADDGVPPGVGRQLAARGLLRTDETGREVGDAIDLGEIEVIERVEILRDLRLGVYDVVVGINLLREGLDLPEVSLVAILDADKEGFLRSRDSLIQQIGRAARHVEGHGSGATRAAAGAAERGGDARRGA